MKSRSGTASGKSARKADVLTATPPTRALATKTARALKATARKPDPEEDEAIDEEGPPVKRRGYLVIVESPAKAKTIKKYLGSGFSVKASVGHVKDLPKSKMGVDPEHDFAPTYEVIKGKAKVLSDIKRAAAGAERTYLATDPDREGEAIAWHIAEEVGGPGVDIQRVLFNEITKKAVQEAIQHPLELDRRKFDSQQARRVLDRLVGYQISPILWKKVRRGLSAGRVQSVAVRLVVERESAIKAFIAVEYWTLDAQLAGRLPPTFLARLAKVDGRKAEIKDQSQSDALVRELGTATYRVVKVDRRERRRNPAPPFITSKLQQEAANRLHFSAKKTMTLAQRLYEGVELGDEGSVGLISYMRTDSTRLSDDAVADARARISKRYGKEFLPAEPNVFRQGKRAQDAHEAIRPTSVEWTPERVQGFLEPDMFRLYELIWNRFLACQMAPAVYDLTSVDIEAGRAMFRATGTILKFAGYLAVYGEKPDESPEKSVEEAKEAEEPEAPSGELPAARGGEKLSPREAVARAALHPAAPALHRGLAGQGAGGEGDRPSLDLRRDPVGDPGQGIRREAREPLLSDRAGDAGQRPAGQGLSERRRRGIHRQHGGAARRDRRGHRGLGQRARRLLRSLQEGARERRRAHAGREARGVPDRSQVREVRLADGHQVGKDGALPGLLGLSRVQDHHRL